MTRADESYFDRRRRRQAGDAVTRIVVLAWMISLGVLSEAGEGIPASALATLVAIVTVVLIERRYG